MDSDKVKRFKKTDLYSPLMKAKLEDTLVGYHYTTPGAYESMGAKGGFAGLIPKREFIQPSDSKGLPDEAYQNVIEGLLEPMPRSWIQNPEFPEPLCSPWWYLIHDVGMIDGVMLLSFELKPTDRAYVVERAHVERELYRESLSKGKSTEKTRGGAFKEFWESRVPVFEYDGSYSMPQLAIWSKIGYNRLRVEWVKPADEVQAGVLDNNTISYPQLSNYSSISS